MKKLLTPAVAAIAVAFAATIISATSAPTSAAAPSLDSEEIALVALINNYRAQEGKGPLLIDTDLNEAADWHSNDMGANNYYSHYDSLNRSPIQRTCFFGYCHSTWKGEVIAGYERAADVLASWKLSVPYNETILSAHYLVIGVGRNYNADSPFGWYWSVDFAGFVAPTSGQAGTPAPTPTASPNPGCSEDADCDGWSNAVENSLGTNPNDACSNNTARNDEHPDAWPPDVNDDRIVNTHDTGVFVFSLNSHRGDQSFNPRLDFNGDGVINTADVGRLATVLNRSC